MIDNLPLYQLKTPRKRKRCAKISELFMVNTKLVRIVTLKRQLILHG